MTKNATCLINLRPFPVERLWVHLSPIRDAEKDSLLIRIPLVEAEIIFDPDKNRAKGETIEVYLRRLIEKFGSFIIDGVLEECRKLNGVEKGPLEYVITSIDSVREHECCLEIAGSVMRGQKCCHG